MHRQVHLGAPRQWGRQPRRILRRVGAPRPAWGALAPSGRTGRGFPGRGAASLFAPAASRLPWVCAGAACGSHRPGDAPKRIHSPPQSQGSREAAGAGGREGPRSGERECLPALSRRKPPGEPPTGGERSSRRRRWFFCYYIFSISLTKLGGKPKSIE